MSDDKPKPEAVELAEALAEREELDQKIARLRQGTPPEQLPLRGVGVSVQRASSFSGPLPPPDILAGYERVRPGAADLILNSFTIEGHHRRERDMLELRVFEADIVERNRRAMFGVKSALVLSLAGFAVVVIGFATDNAVAATIFGATELAALAGVFIYGSESKRRREREDSRPE